MIRPYDCEVYVNGLAENRMVDLKIKGNAAWMTFYEGPGLDLRSGRPIAVMVRDGDEGAAFQGVIQSTSLVMDSHRRAKLYVYARGHGACKTGYLSLEA
jgi:hypothetical protein